MPSAGTKAGPRHNLLKPSRRRVWAAVSLLLTPKAMLPVSDQGCPSCNSRSTQRKKAIHTTWKTVLKPQNSRARKQWSVMAVRELGEV